MKVQIAEKSTGKVIGVFPINLGGYLGQTVEEYFDLAWSCAVDDRLVPDADKDKYEFKSVGE